MNFSALSLETTLERNPVMTWNIRIGINPLSWMNDDLPSLGGETLLETALAEGKEIGYEGFELGNKFPKDGLGLKAKLLQVNFPDLHYCLQAYFHLYLYIPPKRHHWFLTHFVGCCPKPYTVFRLCRYPG